MTTIVNYGLGNVKAFVDLYQRVNIPATVATNSKQIDEAEKLILPGVGSFDWAITMLEASGMRSALDHAVLVRKVPVLGVCVGMQIMANQSEEGNKKGLGWIQGEVVKMLGGQKNSRQILPHMGWNDIITKSQEKIFDNITTPRFYFLHSYYIAPIDPGVVIGKFNYHGNYVCAVKNENIYGTQFHPEKSHSAGSELLKNFALM